jgi:hypothetical protein
MFILFRPVVLRVVSGASSAPPADPTSLGARPANLRQHRLVPQTQRPSETNRSAGANQKMQVLWCEPGEHEWERPSVPGRKTEDLPDARLKYLLLFGGQEEHLLRGRPASCWPIATARSAGPHG